MKLLLVMVLLAGCTTTTDTRSLVCVGFCSDHQIKREVKHEIRKE